MIITFTANPSLDRTVELEGSLEPGGVHRIIGDSTQPGGKGINVALAIHRAGLDVVAVLPAAPGDPLLQLLDREGLQYLAIPVSGAVRTNLTVIAAGETTKINEPGSGLSATEVVTVRNYLTDLVGPGDTVMLSGSLAPGFPTDEYSRLAKVVRQAGAWVGVDTSDAPLVAMAKSFADAAPNFIKPNAEELGQITSREGSELEEQAARGDFKAILAATTDLTEQGIEETLLTLGGAGAILKTKEGCWYAPSPPVEVLSTVGAGDSATAGYLIAKVRGEAGPERLAQAVAYGAAAASLPGTTIPSPEQVHSAPQSIISISS